MLHDGDQRPGSSPEDAREGRGDVSRILGLAAPCFVEAFELDADDGRMGIRVEHGAGV